MTCGSLAFRTFLPRDIIKQLCPDYLKSRGNEFPFCLQCCTPRNAVELHLTFDEQVHTFATMRPYFFIRTMSTEECNRKREWKAIPVITTSCVSTCQYDTHFSPCISTINTSPHPLSNPLGTGCATKLLMCKGLLQWGIHYTNIILHIAHGLRYIWYIRHFGASIYTRLQMTERHYTDRLVSLTLYKSEKTGN
jgi:hypothetical protein